MANAYYEAIAAYLSRRGAHLGYELLSGPSEPVTAGDTVSYVIKVRNKGTEQVRGWRLRVDAVEAPSRYVSRVRNARQVGSEPIRRLRPGRARRVTVEVEAPPTAGSWTLLFDARDPDGRRATELGIPMLQVPLTTVAPPPTASASPSSAPASPQPSPEPEVAEPAT
jgi:hypothetical protein